MSHSLHKIWIHAIWSTKNREALIPKEYEKEIHAYIREQLIALNCHVFEINGMADHVHCLFLLHSQKSIADVMKQVKGATSHFINSKEFSDNKFAWQSGYAAYSVSESGMKQVQQYIKRQKEHHRKKSFSEEYNAFMNVYNAQSENG